MMMKLLQCQDSPVNKHYRSRTARMLIVVAAMIGVLVSGPIPTSGNSATDPSNITVQADGYTILLTFEADVCSTCIPYGMEHLLTQKFAVEVGGMPENLNSNSAAVNINGRTVSIQIQYASQDDKIADHEVVNVAYTAPSGLNETGLEFIGTPNVLVDSFSITATNNSEIDRTPPNFLSAVVSEDRRSVAVTFDESVQAQPGGSVGVTVSDVEVSFGTPTASESTITVPLTAAWESGDVKLIYAKPTDAQPGWTDTSGNKVQDFTATATFAPQRAPELDGAAIGSDGTALTLTFDEALAVTQLATSAFTVTVDGELKEVTFVSNSGASRVLTLASTVVQGATVTVSYTAPESGGLQDAAGIEVASFTNQAVTNSSTVDGTAPQLAEGTAPSLAANGTALTLTFDEALTADVPATSAFTVTAGGAMVAVSGVANSGATSVLTLASAVAQGATVTVSYTTPGSGGLQDAAGNEVASFTAQAVTNSSTVDGTPPQLASGTAPALASNGTALTLTFDEALAADVPATSAFTVTAGGSAVAVSQQITTYRYVIRI